MVGSVIFLLRSEVSRGSGVGVRGGVGVLGVGVLVVGLVGGVVSPVWAGSGDGGGDVVLGSFGLGDGLEAAVGEVDGSFGFKLPVGGLGLGWDSRGVGSDLVGFGAGWGLGLAMVGVSGGVWVYPSSGGVFGLDVSVPSGLAGYPGTDVVFAVAEPGAVVPARGDGVVGERGYAYVLHELGGVRSFFDGDGFPVVRDVVGGDRVDWVWEGGRLVEVVSGEGVVTGLDWSDPGRVVVAPGSNVTGAVPGSGLLHR